TSEYNKLAKFIDEPTLTGEKVVNLSQKDAPSAASVDVKSVQLANDQVLNIDKTEETNVLPTFGGVVVIPDSTSTDGIKAETETIWQPKEGTDKETLIDAENIIGEKYPMLLGTAATVAGITQFYTPVLFVGLFIGIVFFVSAGSFLYFRLYSDMNTDVEKFKMIYKLGLTKKELKKMIYQQVGILFFTPIVVSFIHGAVALKAMYAVLDQPMQLAGWQVLGVFLLIQVVYYLIARTFYFKKVYHLVKD
ncbi:ABC transporter permease, partial [Enterococcus faecalis]|nr:ABC transporter permease [Enterococcus faecalis]